MATPNIELSIVIPVFNEEGSIPILHGELTEVLRRIGLRYEILFVDDGSTDNTSEKLEDLVRRDPHVKVVSLQRNFGQTLALRAGFDHSDGRIVVAMDGDLQFDPEDIPRLIAPLSDGYDMAAGWRRDRPESYLTRVLPSKVANAIVRTLLGTPIRDFGTTFKAYKREALRHLDLQGDLHRFIPALLWESGCRITEVPIRCRPRRFGKSHYGLGRTWGVLLDIIFIKFFVSYLSRPLRMFGSLGLLSLAAGLTIGGALTLTFIFDVHPPISHEILFLLGVLLMVIGVQFITFGLLAEVTVRIFQKVQLRKPYVVRKVRNARRTNVSEESSPAPPEAKSTP